jgi:DNA-binding winged helix-turn-helix (wHTH) protein/tetratricopeptide (TPR) repeat protein
VDGAWSSSTAMTNGPKVLYEFGPFQVDPDKQVLLRGSEPVAITPKVFETLLILVRRSREVVTKDDLIKGVWPDAFVEESNLSQNIFVLRKALGDTAEDRRYIVTIPGRGYRFVAEVRTVAQAGEDVVISSSSLAQMVVEHPVLYPGDEDRSLGTPLPVVVVGTRRKAIGRYGWAAAVVIALLVASTILLVNRHRQRRIALGATDSVLLADFTNTTGDPVFDGTLQQGLEIQLEQSPFLSLVSQDRIRQTMRMMGQPADARLTPEIAREVCERTASAAVLDGSIAMLGSRYVLGLRAKNCRTGDVIAEEQAQAAHKEDVLNALSEIASKFRTRVGESLTTVEKYGTPLADATTPSLDALKAYSAGWKAHFANGEVTAIQLFKHAVELDPKFASAYAALGLMYGIDGESTLAAQNTTKAYELRDRASDNERFFITASYDARVTGNLEKAQQTCEAWAHTYPREMVPHAYLAGIIYPASGKFEMAIEEAKKVVAFEPDSATGYLQLASNYVALDRLDEAESELRVAAARGVGTPDNLVLAYDIAFLRNDLSGMEQAVGLAERNPGAEDLIANREAFALAYGGGRMQDARKALQRATDLARQKTHQERAALFEAGAALWEGFFGDSIEARREAQAALADSNDREVEYGAAFALALAGDEARSQFLADDLEKRFPEDTSVRFNYVPAVRGLLAVRRGAGSQAAGVLQSALPYELGQHRSSVHGNFGALYPIYVRGEAYLAARQGAAAAAEFQKILDHRGIVVSDPVGVLAQLELGRAYAQSGDKTKAKSAYSGFLGLVKDADAAVPMVKQARTEFARLEAAH